MEKTLKIAVKYSLIIYKQKICINKKSTSLILFLIDKYMRSGENSIIYTGTGERSNITIPLSWERDRDIVEDMMSSRRKACSWRTVSCHAFMVRWMSELKGLANDSILANRVTTRARSLNWSTINRSILEPLAGNLGTGMLLVDETYEYQYLYRPI